MRSIYTAATGMIAQQTQIDVTSHNIANVNTYGYKKNLEKMFYLLGFVNGGVEKVKVLSGKAM